MANISPTLRYLSQYLTEGPITFETEKNKMDRISAAIPSDIPEKMKKQIKSLLSTQDENNVHIKVDAENDFLIEYPNSLYDECPYVIGERLASKTLERVAEDPTIIFTILNITENLSQETTLGVIHKLGLSITDFSFDKTSPRQYTKDKTNKNENLTK